MRTPATASRERGQASLEFLGVLPLLVVLGLAAFQLLAVGYSSVLAGSAAEAGALAHARVTVEHGRVTVRLRPPSLLRAIAERLEVRADAAVEDT